LSSRSSWSTSTATRSIPSPKSVDTLLVVALELEYIDRNTLDTFTEEFVEVRRILQGLLNRLRDQ
jgi:hypothetical protein